MALFRGSTSHILPFQRSWDSQRDQNPILFSLVAEQSRFPQKFACIVYFSASSKGEKKEENRNGGGAIALFLSRKM